MLEIKEICRKYGIAPLRRRGQNFLVNKRVLERVLEVAELNKNDIILEIGAGLGTLTKELAQRVKKVVAVEIDKKFVEILREETRGYKNIEIVPGDILDNKIISYFRKSFVFRSGYKIVANLPYNITGAVLRKFLHPNSAPPPRFGGTSAIRKRPPELPRPKLLVLMLQKEVAKRICARPRLCQGYGGQAGKMSLLSVAVQFYGQPKIIKFVSRNNFWPRPRVDSAILRISRISTNLPRIDTNLFFKMVRAGFSSPRKYLINNLVRNKIAEKEKIKKIFQKINLNEKIRAQELSIEQWQILFKNFFKNL